MKNGIHTDYKLVSRRKELRNKATPQEQELWKYLKGRKLRFKFQRQHSIGPYIVDFYCAQKKLIIEIDGDQHRANKEYDEERTGYLELYGYKVIRFWNSEIDTNIINIVNTIERVLTYRE